MKRSNYLLKTFLFLVLSAKISAQSATQGFFLNDWQAKNITAPSYTDATKPIASPTATISIDVNNVVTKVSKYLFGNNSNPYMGQMVTEPTLLNYLKDLSPNVIRAPGG